MYVPSTLKAMWLIIRLDNMRHMLQPLLIHFNVILVFILTCQDNMWNRNFCRIPDLDKGRTGLRTNDPFGLLGARQRNEFTTPAKAYRGPFFNARVRLCGSRDNFRDQRQGLVTIGGAIDEGG